MPETDGEPGGTTRPRDRSFGPTVLVGLLGSTLLAVAGHRDWLTLSTTAQNEGALSIFTESSPGLAQEPLAGAMGLVALAGWGVLLVTRGWVRRVAAGLGVVAGIGGIVAWFDGMQSMRDTVLDRSEPYGLAEGLTLAWNAWFPAALVGAVLVFLSAGVAVARVGRWPAMGARYDAPTAAGSQASDAGDGGSAASGTKRENLDEADPTELWKSLDKGHDPT